MTNPYKISRPFTEGVDGDTAVISCSIEGKNNRIIKLGVHKAVLRPAFNTVLIEYRGPDVNKATTHYATMVPEDEGGENNPPVKGILKFANNSLEKIVEKINAKAQEQKLSEQR